MCHRITIRQPPPPVFLASFPRKKQNKKRMFWLRLALFPTQHVLYTDLFALPVHIHDHARRAVAALTAVILGQPLLDRVESTGLVTYPLCGGNLPTIYGVHQTQALGNETERGFNKERDGSRGGGGSCGIRTH